MSESLRGGRAVLGIPHQTPGDELAQSGGPLRCLEDGIHGMRGHLRERETQLAGESGTLTLPPISQTKIIPNSILITYLYTIRKL